MRVKPYAFKVHRWLGLTLCAWLLLLGLSGSLLAFRASLEAGLHPELYLVRGVPSPPDFDRMSRAVGARHPDRRIIGFTRAGLRPDESFHVILTAPARGGRPPDIRAPGFNPVADADLEVFVDPGSGAILGERPFWNALAIVYWFHKELLLPFKGAPYLGALGCCLLTLATAGLLYWWPRRGGLRRGLRVVVDRGWRRMLRDLHVSAGAVLAMLLLVSAATGVFMCFEIVIEDAMRSVGLADAAPPAAAATPAAGGRPIGVQQAVNAALAPYPGFDAVLVNLPVAGGGTYHVQLFPRRGSRVWWTVEVEIDAVTGRPVSLFDPRRQSAGSSLPLWVIFLHNGQMFGAAGQFVVMSEGMVLVLLVLSGPCLWWMRRRPRATSGRFVSRETNRAVARHKAL